MTWLLAYFSIGVLFNFLVDLLVDYFEKHEIEDTEKMRFNLATKILTTLFWPLAIIILIYAIIKKQKDES